MTKDMKKSLEGFLHYIGGNFFSCWLVLGVDTFLAVLCTFLLLSVSII